jgi:hypothetical protein
MGQVGVGMGVAAIGLFGQSRLVNTTTRVAPMQWIGLGSGEPGPTSSSDPGDQ